MKGRARTADERRSFSGAIQPLYRICAITSTVKIGIRYSSLCYLAQEGRCAIVYTGLT